MCSRPSGAQGPRLTPMPGRPSRGPARWARSTTTRRWTRRQSLLCWPVGTSHARPRILPWPTGCWISWRIWVYIFKTHAANACGGSASAPMGRGREMGRAPRPIPPWGARPTPAAGGPGSTLLATKRALGMAAPAAGRLAETWTAPTGSRPRGTPPGIPAPASAATGRVRAAGVAGGTAAPLVAAATPSSDLGPVQARPR
mmetsp:Transcript_19199/g.62706  ORF Transcript_19199/g.62706 Transcript_19199/m.62706 type:complete len:200 (-) Transcript_19199:662-1261(-)